MVPHGEPLDAFMELSSGHWVKKMSLAAAF